MKKKQKMIINPSYTKCPQCEAMYSYSDMPSENTSGVEFWSDGFCMAPMRMDVIQFAKCPACNTVFLIQENSIQEPTDLTNMKKLENSWTIDNISSNEIDFIKTAFRSGLANTTEKEILLRIKLWHTINHIMRKYHSQGLFKKIKQKLFETAEYKDSLKQYNTYSSLKLNNLIRLVNLLKLDKNEDTNYLLFAEIYRELGDFGKALFFCHKAETSPQADLKRIMLLKQYISNKSKTTYKL